MPTFAPSPETTTPFLIEHAVHEPKPGEVLPAPRILLLTRNLRTCGLLERMSGEATRALLALLACLNPNGRIRPDVREIAALLGVEERIARKWLGQLAHTGFEGEPLVRLETHESGLETVHLSARAVAEVVPPPLPAEEPPALVSSREEIIAHSRAAYARPRAEVERDILRQLGHEPEETEPGPVGDAWRRLSALGVPNEQIRRLIDAFSLDVINDQIDWLPLRGEVRNRARYVIAAIEGNYEPPARVRLERTIAAAEETAAVPAVGDSVSLTLPEPGEAAP